MLVDSNGGDHSCPRERVLPCPSDVSSTTIFNTGTTTGNDVKDDRDEGVCTPSTRNHPAMAYNDVTDPPDQLMVHHSLSTTVKGFCQECNKLCDGCNVPFGLHDYPVLCNQDSL